MSAPVDYTNDIRQISALDNFMSINNAVDIDLYGQINAESAGTKQISGAGGQLDFVLGAYLSNGGKSFICMSSTFKKKDGVDMEELILDLIDYDVDDEFEEDEEEGTITIYGDPKSYAAIQKHLEECGFEDVGGEFTYIPNDTKEVTPEQRETLDKMIERLEEFDDVQTVYTNMKPEEGGE